MGGFEELGLNETLVERALEQGLSAPSALQRSVIPVLRRGGNAIIRASSGSGVTAAYAMALIDRFGDRTGTHALVIVPTADRAERVASTIAAFAYGSAARVTALTSAWSAAHDATIVVASAEKLRNAVEESQLKLEGVEAVVVDNAAAIVKLSGEQALETIFTSLPRDGQRIIITAELTEPVKKLTDAHARKALTFPPRPAVEERSEPTESELKLRYVVAATARKADYIARLARGGGAALTILCRSASTAGAVERALCGRGFNAHGATYDGFDKDEIAGALYAFDPPFSAEQISECFRNGDVILCERQELSHLKTIAADANVRLESANMPAAEPDALQAFRNEIRRAAREEDLAAQLLVLEPLFDELSPEEVAAAATALLRARRPVKAEAAAGSRAGVKTFARLFLSVGERDGIRAGDIVGAITGESGVRGEEVGRVDIRDTFSVVEVESSAAERVIRALNGTTMKNRALRVDYDRKTSPGGNRGGRPQAGGARKEGGVRRPRPGNTPTRRDR